MSRPVRRLLIEMPSRIVEEDPLWWSSTAVVDEQFVAKFAWSRPAALRVAHEIGVLTALARPPSVPFLPEVVAWSTDPLLLMTRRVPGVPLFEVIHSIDRDHAGNQLAEFLAALHQPATRVRVEAANGPLPDAHHGPQHPASTQVLRDRLGVWFGPTSAAPSRPGASGRTPRSRGPVRPCSSTPTSTATTRCGQMTRSGSSWTSRPPYSQPEYDLGTPRNRSAWSYCTATVRAADT